MLIGYHSSHEQFSPRELLDLIPLAEKAGFNAVMSSDHIAPWSARQGQSGHTWAWLGAAMQNSSLPFGSLAIPGGWRYHPAVVAQAFATLAQMFPGRLPWIAAGSGERMNEHITGMPWPDRDERNARLLEGVEMIRALWKGETVTRDTGFLKTHEAKIWSLPSKSPSIYAAVISEETASWAGSWADGIITVRKPIADLQKILNAFHRGGGEGKPIVLQMQVSWAETRDEALYNAWDQWRHTGLAPEKIGVLESPEDFDRACEGIKPEKMADTMLVSSQAEDFIGWIKEYAALGFTEVFLHNAGRNQSEFIEFFGKNVLTAFKS